MSRPKTLPVPRTFDPGPFRWTGLLLIGVAMLSACDLDYPTTIWTDPDYDHAALSDGFDLTGPHEGSVCTSCHAPPTYELIYEPADNQDCVACHEAEFEVQHGSDGGYPTTCLTCHDGEGWERVPFDHEVESGGFELWGSHTLLNCESCHVPETFEPRWDPVDDQDCAACHG